MRNDTLNATNNISQNICSCFILVIALLDCFGDVYIILFCAMIIVIIFPNSWRFTVIISNNPFTIEIGNYCMIVAIKICYIHSLKHIWPCPSWVGRVVHLALHNIIPISHTSQHLNTSSISLFLSYIDFFSQTYLLFHHHHAQPRRAYMKSTILPHTILHIFSIVSIKIQEYFLSKIYLIPTFCCLLVSSWAHYWKHHGDVIHDVLLVPK